jgi:uncharacterized protein YwgA
MIERENIVAAVLDAAGGRMVSRVRLQKAVYLLDRLGLNSEFDFDYHHFGPFSRDLDNAVVDAKAFGFVDEKFEHRQSDGAAYSVFILKKGPEIDAYGDLGLDRTREIVSEFLKTHVTVLELAATVDWLWRFEKEPDWKGEITRRKGIKVQGGRLERAIDLLKLIDLQPPTIPAN